MYKRQVHNDPANDPFLPAPYSAADLSGKAACKAALQEKLGLDVNPDVPIIACISRLVAHKGYGLVTAAFPKIMEMCIRDRCRGCIRPFAGLR